MRPIPVFLGTLFLILGGISAISATVLLRESGVEIFQGVPLALAGVTSSHIMMFFFRRAWRKFIQAGN